MPTDTNQVPIGDLLNALARQASTLIRQEIDLAQTEMRQNAARLQRNVTVLFAGGLIAFLGFGGLVAMGIVLLSQVVPAWEASGIIGGAVALLGIILLIGGSVALRRTQLAPTRTLRAMMAPTPEAHT
jgi:hypothetical protein